MCTSEVAFAAALDAGALPLVTNLTRDSSDVLLQLNALELLEKARRTERVLRAVGVPMHLLSFLRPARLRRYACISHPKRK